MILNDSKLCKYSSQVQVQVPHNFYKYFEINRLLFLPDFQRAEWKKENFKDLDSRFSRCIINLDYLVSETK